MSEKLEIQLRLHVSRMGKVNTEYTQLCCDVIKF